MRMAGTAATNRAGDGGQPAGGRPGRQADRGDQREGRGDGGAGGRAPPAVVAPAVGEMMARPATLADLMADPGELELWCEACHHHAAMPMAALLSRYAPDTPFPEVRGGVPVLGLRLEVG